MKRFFRTGLALLMAALLVLAAPTARAQASQPLRVLLIGEDAASGDHNGRSDAMLLLQITPETGQVKLVSFLRDLYVPIPGHGKTRLNAAYFYGGADLLKQTLANTFDVTIDRTLTVDFATMADLIDQIGGLEIDITEAERRELNIILEAYCLANGIPLDALMVKESGRVPLTGLQALSFSRIRRLDSDFGRVGRQQQVLSALLQKLMQQPSLTLLRLAVVNLNKVKTDLTLKDVIGLLPLLSAKGGLRLDSARVPFDNTSRDVQVNGMWVLDTNLKENTRLLADFLARQ